MQLSRFVLTLSLGFFLLLRLVYMNDIEYKYDEQYMFERSQAVGKTEPWPLIGMNSSAGLPNPGASVWTFVGLARLTGATTPPELSQAVGLICFVGFLLLVALGALYLREPERSIWEWGMSVAAISPMVVLFQRKIWAQSLLPFFLGLFWCAWMKRSQPWGAFCVGLVGVLLGQVHMSGFFFFAAVFLGTSLSGNLQMSKKAFLAGVLGTSLGVLPMIPWLMQIRSQNGMFHFHFSSFLGSWFMDALGWGLTRSLRNDFWEFLKWPAHTYVVGLAHAVTGSFLLWGLATLKAQFNSKSPLALMLLIGFVGYGLLVSVFSPGFYRHYIVVVYPLTFMSAVWILYATRLSKKTRDMRLLFFWIAQLVISISFLQFIHERGGSTAGEYGVSYRNQ